MGKPNKICIELDCEYLSAICRFCKPEWFCSLCIGVGCTAEDDKYRPYLCPHV